MHDPTMLVILLAYCVQALVTDPLTEEAMGSLLQQRDRLLVTALRLRSRTPSAAQHVGGGFKRRPASARPATHSAGASNAQQPFADLALAGTQPRRSQPAHARPGSAHPQQQRDVCRRQRPQSAAPLSTTAQRAQQRQRARPHSAHPAAQSIPAHIRLAVEVAAFETLKADAAAFTPLAGPAACSEPRTPRAQSARPHAERNANLTPVAQRRAHANAFPARNALTATGQRAATTAAPCMQSPDWQKVQPPYQPKSASASPRSRSRVPSVTQRRGSSREQQPLISESKVDADAASRTQTPYTLAYSLGMVPASCAAEGGESPQLGLVKVDTTNRCVTSSAYATRSQHAEMLGASARLSSAALACATY
jgi:hypothetical protein